MTIKCGKCKFYYANSNQSGYCSKQYRCVSPRFGCIEFEELLTKQTVSE